jgi:PAT family beta-lactamase induction signal transducer AmpG
VTLRRTLAVVAGLYFIEGFPMGVYADVWPVYFRRHGVELEAIGWLSTLGLAWSAKVLWSPLVDRFGERRGWIAGALAVMSAALAAVAGLGAQPDALLVGVLAAYCLASATQDVAIDAYTIGLCERGQEGPVNAARTTAYRIGLVTAGGGLLFLPRWIGWPGTFACAAAVSAALAPAVFRAPRIAVPPAARAQTLAPLARWLRLPGAAGVLGFVMLFRVGDLAMGPMVKPLWVDRGFSDEEIGTITTVLGSLATVAGAAIGGAFVARFGIARGLLWLGLAALGSNLGYAAAAASPEAWRPAMIAASLAESLCAGLAVTAFLSFCMRICEKEHAAVQYALLSALFVLPGRLIGGASGQLTAQFGYATYFALTAACALPAFAFLPWARRRLAWLDEQASAQRSAGSGASERT